MTFRIVPDVLRSRKRTQRGREPKSDLSKALLRGSTVFIKKGAKKNLGSLYTLAKNHNMLAKMTRTSINDEEGTLVWFMEEKNDTKVE